MKIVAVVGTGSGSGKTTVVCRLLRSLPGLGAVKISPRDGEGRVELGPGEAGKDTACYAAAGAARVARIVGPRGSAAQAWRSVEDEFRGLPGVVVEGAGSLELPGDRMTILVADHSFTDRIERNGRLASISDAIIIVSPTPAGESTIFEAIAIHSGPASAAKTRAPGESRDDEWGRIVAAVRDFLDIAVNPDRAT